MNIKKIDKENMDFYAETVSDVEHGKLTLKDILGFHIEGATVFIPRVPCAQLNPTLKTCKSADEDTSPFVYSLAPIYDSLIYPINELSEKPLNEKTFEELHNISLDNFITFVEKSVSSHIFQRTIASMTKILSRGF